MRRASRAIIIKDEKLLVTKRNKFGHEYYILIGGGVDMGETEEQALYREIKEESGVQVQNPRLVYVENAGDMYGMQYIFLCEYVDGEPVLDPESMEAKISAVGQNTYVPMWLSFAELATVPFRSDSLRKAIVGGIQSGFPASPVDITNQ